MATFRKSRPAGPAGLLTLTVVLPNYNHGRDLPHALDALLAQDRPADEIIVIDDGSTDASREVMCAYAARGPAVRVLVNSANLGAIATLQRGLETARGRYVYFAAADDWVWPGFFRRALEMLEVHPQVGFFCGEAALVDAGSGRPIGVRPIARPRLRAGAVSSAQTLTLLRKIDNWILTGSAVFRREAVLEAGGFDPRLGPFADGFMARKVALAHGFCFAPGLVSTWCVSATGLSRVAALKRRAEIEDAVSALIAADPVFPPWYAETFRRRWRFAAARLALEARRKSPVARLFALALLWMRDRPTSLTRVLATALARRADGTRRRSR